MSRQDFPPVPLAPPLPQFASAGEDDIINDIYSGTFVSFADLSEEPYHHHLSMRANIIRTCSSFLRTQRIKAAGLATPAAALRTFKSPPPHALKEAAARTDGQDDRRKGAEEAGAMSRRLAEMTEESIETGGISAAKNVEAAGFSEELKKQLESRIADGAFRSQHQRAFAEAELPSSAGKGTRDQATAQPWSGSESLHDSALRMLDDSHKRLRSVRAPGIPQPTNLRPTPKKPTSTGERLASARDRTSIYAAALSNEMSEGERNQMRKELKERFSPGARPMPTTLQGLTSLANERIEDAIARGQFKNIPRGKGKNVERDYNASSPFLDTTEYFMNKIIQKQEIVPPWIEKQQELVKNVASFRGRLKNDWKRHAARVIASKGGSLESQIRRAQAYALAEARVNPLPTKNENLSKIDNQGNISTITVQETKHVSSAAAVVPTVESRDREALPEAHTTSSSITITETSATAPEDPSKSTISSTFTVTAPPAEAPSSLQPTTHPPPPPPSQPSTTTTPFPSPILPAPHPFRDPLWEATEHAYHALAITSLNNLTRSYNLMAPSLAQKPYFSLPRELARCYADVAPLLPEEIRQRASAPRVKTVEASGEGMGRAVLGRLGGGAGEGGRWKGHEVTRYRDEDLQRKGYGFRQFWRDLWGRKEAEREGERRGGVGV